MKDGRWRNGFVWLLIMAATGLLLFNTLPSMRSSSPRTDVTNISNIAALVKQGLVKQINLTEDSLSRADLYGANLYGANLTGANLTGADLRGASLSLSQVEQVIVSLGIKILAGGEEK